jgi:hypothetical protein
LKESPVSKEVQVCCKWVMWVEESLSSGTGATPSVLKAGYRAFVKLYGAPGALLIANDILVVYRQ